MQMIVVQDTIIYPFAGSAVIVNLFIFIRTARNRRIKTDVPFRFRVNAPAIGGRGTFPFAGAGIRFAAGKRTAPFAGVFLFTVAPVDHAEACHAQWDAVRINGYGVRDGTRSAPVRVQVDKRADIPFLAKPISGIVVMSGVQTEIFDRDVRVKRFKFPERDNGADAVMPPGVEETDMQGQVNPNVSIVGAEHVEGMSKIEDFLITVPPPVCVRVREMAFTGTVGNAVFHTFADLMPIRGGMGMDTGAVAGEGNAVRREKSVLEGRYECGKPEKLLETFFIMEREAFMREGISGQFLCNAGMLIGKLLSFAGFLGRFGILILWEKILPAGFL